MILSSQTSRCEDFRGICHRQTVVGSMLCPSPLRPETKINPNSHLATANGGVPAHVVRAFHPLYLSLCVFFYLISSGHSSLLFSLITGSRHQPGSCKKGHTQVFFPPHPHLIFYAVPAVFFYFQLFIVRRFQPSPSSTVKLSAFVNAPRIIVKKTGESRSFLRDPNSLPWVSSHSGQVFS